MTLAQVTDPDEVVFPAEATGPACYGPSIKAHALYLMCAQHLPRERCAQALADLFAVPVSTGTLDNWMREAAEALVGFLAAVAAQLQAAPVVHADETSVRSGKAALWFHVCCTQLFTLLHVGRRDKTTIEAGPRGEFTGTIVHDRLPHYFNYGTGHVLCNAHILRSLNELLGNHRQRDWAQAFIDLIVDTKPRSTDWVWPIVVGALDRMGWVRTPGGGSRWRVGLLVGRGGAVLIDLVVFWRGWWSGRRQHGGG